MILSMYFTKMQNVNMLFKRSVNLTIVYYETLNSQLPAVRGIVNRFCFLKLLLTSFVYKGWDESSKVDSLFLAIFRPNMNFWKKKVVGGRNSPLVTWLYNIFCFAYFIFMFFWSDFLNIIIIFHKLTCFLNWSWRKN